MKKLLIVLMLTACATDPAIRRQQIALNIATVIDMESTFAGLAKCGDGCREANPLLAGPIDRGRLLTYAVQLGLNALVIHMAERTKEKSFWRYLPWSLTAGHGVAATLNFRFLIETSDAVVAPVPVDEVADAGRH
jgi:hypothetical protein